MADLKTNDERVWLGRRRRRNQGFEIRTITSSSMADLKTKDERVRVGVAVERDVERSRGKVTRVL